MYQTFQETNKWRTLKDEYFSFTNTYAFHFSRWFHLPLLGDYTTKFNFAYKCITENVDHSLCAYNPIHHILETLP